MTGEYDAGYEHYIDGLHREIIDYQIEVEQVKGENAKLRELVARLICHIENPPCESCMMEMSCAGGEGLTNCDEYQFMVCDARELGVEV